ncbi:MAG TPA: hypothetical protein VJ901_08695 [Thermoanaerobaculia bacterium]|nr:hypothetical protein [Thermoanaerobaculia bacterium]
MQKQLAQSHDFLSQLSAHMNLGDLRLARNENALSRAEYTQAYELAAKQRVEARKNSNLSQYATATAYAGLAKAKLGDAAQSFALLDEATRYASDDAKTWNLFSTAMSILGRTAKATSAARNAVAIADNPLDLNIYRYTLATTLGDTNESEQLLTTVIRELQSPQFDALRREIAKKEAFEIYSTARGEEAAYLSLMNRARLRLASLYEKRGDIAKARATYESVLKDRNDEPAALAAIARLSRSESDYAEAFDANPFSLELIRDYQRYVASHPASVEGDSIGAQVRRAIREPRLAIELAKKHPENDALRTLAREATSAPVPAWLQGNVETATPTPAELRTLLTHELTPDERRALDRVVLSANATFNDAQSGTIGDVKFRLAQPVTSTPSRISFRILGASGDTLLIEVVP